MKKSSLTLFLALAGPAALLASEPWTAFSVVTPEAASPGCRSGVVVDDGSYESAYGLGGGTPGAATMVQRLGLGFATELDQVCICFTRDQANPGQDNFDFQVVLYDDNGANGSPGTFIGAVAATATDVPIFPQFTHYGVNLAASGIDLPGGSVYVGARWPGGQSHFVCGDRSGGTPQRDLYLSGNQGGSWSTLSAVFGSDAPRALGIGADLLSAGSGCQASDSTLCLIDERFSVVAVWQTGTGEQGVAHAVNLTDRTGYFWFFHPDNVEMVVKLHDGCILNDHYWMFAAGLTNVRVELYVTDTQTGTLRQYVNPQNTAFQPIQDTDAFPTCP